MEYKEEIVKGLFIERKNRFIATVKIKEEEVLCHVKNTGRLKELLLKDASVYLEKSFKPERKTAYSLIGVEKDGFLVNIDSQAPNKMVKEWLEEHAVERGLTLLKPEAAFQKSRFDFYVEAAEKRTWIEVKGVTLVKDGMALFPDAPTERGVKHLNELCAAVEQGFGAEVIFVIQRKGVKGFEPNAAADPAFAVALKRAKEKGVIIRAYDSLVAENGAAIDTEIPVFI